MEVTVFFGNGADEYYAETNPSLLTTADQYSNSLGKLKWNFKYTSQEEWNFLIRSSGRKDKLN